MGTEDIYSGKKIIPPSPFPAFWSSYRANACGANDPLLTSHDLFVALGRDPAKRQFAYRELFSRGLEAGEVHEIREMLNQELLPGREDFRDSILQMTQRRVRRGRGRETTAGGYRGIMPFGWYISENWYLTPASR
jgi:hypothetical protein